MLISASWRTDIPSYYADWSMNRLEAVHISFPIGVNKNRYRFSTKTVCQQS